MSSWIQKASNLIDTLDQVATKQAEAQKDESNETEQAQPPQIQEEQEEKAEEPPQDADTKQNEIATHESMNEAVEVAVETKSEALSTIRMDSNQVALKNQYEGILKLWNEERANLKKAQQLLRNQKKSFEVKQEQQQTEHMLEINALIDKHNDEMKTKQTAIESMETSLLRVKEERNNKMEDSHELKERMKSLETEKLEILQEKSANALKKQQEIELIRNEFDAERKNWEKERSILTKNFERETFLENENVEYTNALARTQSNLQQKELENTRLKGELKWIKRDKDEANKASDLMKQENEALHQQMNSLQEIIGDKNKEILTIKNEENEKYNELKIDNDKLKQQLNEAKDETQNIDHAKITRDFERRINDLTTSLLEKQTQIDMVMSQKNEIKIKLDKLMEDNTININTMNNNNNGHNNKKDIELGLIRRPVTNRIKALSSRSMKRRNFTNYKSINYGINVFDRIGLEFAHVLRNRPWIRLLIVFYIIVLHLWCFIVLHFSINFSEDDEHHLIRSDPV